MRSLGNQMIHEFVERPVVLICALQAGHAFVPGLIAAADNMSAEIGRPE